MNRNELLAEADELADLMIQTPEIVRYQEAEHQMKENAQAVAMIRRLRDLQEEVGEFMSRRVPEQHYRYLVEESESLLEQLEKIPAVSDFLAAQAAVNDLLQTVTSRLAQAVTAPLSETENG